MEINGKLITELLIVASMCGGAAILTTRYDGKIAEQHATPSTITDTVTVRNMSVEGGFFLTNKLEIQTTDNAFITRTYRSSEQPQLDDLQKIAGTGTQLEIKGTVEDQGRPYAITAQSIRPLNVKSYASK